MTSLGIDKYDMEIDMEIEDLPYLLFAVGKNIYGISSKFVRGIETLDNIITLADSDPTVRGGVIYQDSFINLIDMRRLFGLDSQVEEFEKSVQPEQRIKDHENWVTSLERSVLDRSEFTLTDDPHKCAFGRWFYSYKTDNNTLRHQLDAIEAPHKAVHNTAKVVKKLMQENNHDAAMSAIREMRATHYRTTLHILSSLREMVINNLKEIYVVIDSADGIKGIIVDTIEGVEFLDDTLHIPEAMPCKERIEFLGRRKNNNGMVIVLNNSI